MGGVLSVIRRHLEEIALCVGDMAVMARVWMLP